MVGWRMVFVVLTLGACAAARTVSYRTGALPSTWRSLHLEGAQQTFHHEAGGSIFSNSSCNVSDADAPLDVLTNHLLFELEDVKEQSRERMVLDGRAALLTRLTAKLDGVPIALDLVVLKKDGCSVDLHLVASPAVIEARRPDFERYVHGFSLSGRAR